MTTLLLLFIILAAFALLYWGVTQLALPPMVKTVLIVVAGMFALVFLYNMVSGGGLSLRLR